MKTMTLKLKTLILLGSLLFSNVTIAEDGMAYPPFSLGTSFVLENTVPDASNSSLLLSLGTEPTSNISGLMTPYLKGHYGMNIDSTLGTNYKYSPNSFSDQFLQKYPYQFDSNYFSKKEEKSKLFNFTDCNKTCDKTLPNCGWGALPAFELKHELSKCGMSMSDLTLEPVIVDESNRISCHSLAIENPANLDSLAQIIGYDCRTQKKDGENDAAFCGCILKKANNPKERLFSPLSIEEKSRIAAMVQLDEFQKKTEEVKSGLLQVSKILAAAIHDSDTRDLFEKGGTDAQACLPGSFLALETKFSTRDDKGALLCGDQGSHRLKKIFQKSVLDCANNEDCSKEWPKISRAKHRIEKGGENSPTIFDFLQHQSVRHYKRNYQGGHERGGRRGEAAFEHEVEQVKMDILTEQVNLCSDIPDSDDQEAIRKYNENCNQEAAQAMPVASLNYLGSLVSYIDEFRSNDKYETIDDFVADLENDPSQRQIIENIKSEMMENFKVLKVGVFDNHSNTKTPFAKILNLVNDSIGEEVELNSNSSTSLNQASNALEFGFKDVKRKVTEGAMKACNQYLLNLALTCKSMDEKPEAMIKNKPSVLDMTYFDPAGAAERFLENQEVLKDMYPTTSDVLRRKFELFRCGNLMRDPDLGKLAYDGEGYDLEAYKSVFDTISDPKLKEGTASKTDVTKDEKSFNIFAEDVEGFRETLSRSDKQEGTDFEELGKAIGKVGKRKSFTGSLKSISDKTLGGSANAPVADAEVADSTTTLKNIAKMTKDTLSNAAPSGSADMKDFSSSSEYAKSVASYNKDKLNTEKEKVAKDKKAADDRLDVIASRLADLMESKKKNDLARSKAEKNSDEESLGKDPKYQEMLIEKLRLEKEIASLGVEKRKKLRAKQDFEEKLTAIEKAEESKKIAAKKVATAKANSKAKAKKAKASSGGGSGSGGSRKIASVGSAGGASGGSSFSGSFEAAGTNFNSAPYVITLTQDQVSAIKQNFQVVDSPKKWVAGGKPPVIREGNIFYELEVVEGKIVVPFKKKALNGFNVAGLRVPASDKEPLPMKVDKKDVERRRAARVKELNALLDSKE